MARSLEVTELQVVGRTGANRRPASGYATFSDGRTYHFSWHHWDEHWSLSTSVRTHQGAGRTSRSFRSRTREAAVQRAVDAV